jgi:hypothetical protein
MKIRKGQIVALFAYDIGYEISLERLDALLANMPLGPLTQKKQNPAYLQYARPPRLIELGGTGEAGAAQAALYDFGAASIAFRYPLVPPGGELAWDHLPAISQAIFQRNLEAEARHLIEELRERIRPAIARPALSPLVEDYYLFIIEEMDGPYQAQDVIEAQRAMMAQVLRFEVQPLSHEQQFEATGQAISYLESDLVVIDWNAAIICDRDYRDAAHVLELLNVELLEARYIDSDLDRRIGRFQTTIAHQASWLIPLRTPYRREIADLGQLKIESLLLAERAENALKLIGDLYLARVHAAASERFYLREWEASINRKLDIVEDFYRLLTDRVRNTQSHTLELIIILLILFEIMMAIFRAD